MKRKPVPVEEQVAYLELFNQMLSEMLQDRYDRAEGGEASTWTVPGLGTGRVVDLAEMREMNNRGVEQAMGVSQRYKRRDNLLSFIKKTVVPYPRLG